MNFSDVFVLDDQSGRLFWRAPPPNHAHRVGKEAGYACVGKGKNKTYWHVRVGAKTFKRSRVVFFMVHGRWPTPAVDHINGNSLDDRPTNLRECNYSQNAANSRDKRRTFDLPRGVYLTLQGRYLARFAGRSYGTFDTPGEASAAFQKAKKEAFGDFA